MNREPKIKLLIARQIMGINTSQEAEQVENWRNKSIANEKLYCSIADHDRLTRDLELYSSLKWEAAYQKAIKASQGKKVSIAKVVMQWAAVLIFAALTGVSIYILSDISTETSTLAEHKEQPGHKARLIKSDGVIVDLSTEQSFKIKETSGVEVTNEQGEMIIYSAEGKESPNAEKSGLKFNTLEIPRGGEYQLQLADGTKVWLNAATTLKYPVAFNGSERNVYLTGEAYFDVAKDGKPFIVHTQGGQVEVLGTQFNVKAYPEEWIEAVTLEEGKVRVKTGEGNEKDMLPGQQTVFDKKNGLLNVQAVNTCYYTGWREGVFRFDGETLEGVMSALARWYDFKYEFEKTATQNLHFSGTLKRYDSAQKVFGMIEQTANVKIVIQDDHIIIK